MARIYIVSLMLVFTLSFSITVFSATLEKIFLPSPGPHTTTFDSSGRGPYIGVTDGRIFRYNKSINTLDFYAVTAPNR